MSTVLQAAPVSGICELEDDFLGSYKEHRPLANVLRFTRIGADLSKIEL